MRFASATGAIVHSASRWAGGKPDGKGTAIIFFVSPRFLHYFLIVVVPTLVPSGSYRFVGRHRVLICLAAITSAGLLVTYAGLKASYQTLDRFFTASHQLGFRRHHRDRRDSDCSVAIPTCCQDLPLDYRRRFGHESGIGVVTAGFGTSTPQQIELKKDEYIDIKSVVGDASIVENDVQFKCGLQSPSCVLAQTLH